MSEQENERYARVDTQGGFLYNKSDISYFKQTQAIDVMNNLMLGDFNKKGAYVLDQSLIDQLVKVKKVYQYSFGSTTFCQSMYDIGGYGKIDFAIKIRNNAQNGTTTAVLQLLETIDRANGYYQNTNTASIATFTQKESNSFIVDMLKHFNVVSKKDEGLLRTDKREEDIDIIVARRKYMDLLKKGSSEKIETINKELYEKRLKLLGKSAVGKKILADLNSETYKINGWFLKEGMPGYYRYLNQILDGLIERRSAEVLQDVALIAGLRKAQDVAALAISTVCGKANNSILENSKENTAMQQQVQNRENALNPQPKQQEQKQEQKAQQADVKAKPEAQQAKQPETKPAEKQVKQKNDIENESDILNNIINNGDKNSLKNNAGVENKIVETFMENTSLTKEQEEIM